MTYDYVLQRWNQTDRKSMYLDSGSLIKFSSDISKKAGPLWIRGDSSMQNGTDGYIVRSCSLYTSIDFPIANVAGMYYCKLMSPARMLEWMLVDSLKRKHYWVPNEIGGSKSSKNEDLKLEFLEFDFIR
jgi:hypothetical protein